MLQPATSSENVTAYDFSILIPTWNNLDMLQCCIRSIKRHSKLQIQILIFVNEDLDDTSSWLQKQKIDHLKSKTNIGICSSMNQLRSLVKAPFICYLNDDMYVLPNWDTNVFQHIKSMSGRRFFISSTMIEPRDHNNPATIVADFGDNLFNFQEEKLLNEYSSFTKYDWSGSSWPPLFMSSALWDEIGGFSEEFSPGMYSDPDMAIKAWQKGNRIYLGVGSSRVYHFGSKSTKRVKKNKGRQTFILKWGMSSRFFYKKFLKMGADYSGPLAEYKVGWVDKIINKLKVWKVR